MTVRAGDIAIFPAGTGHRPIEASKDFLIVGASNARIRAVLSKRANALLKRSGPKAILCTESAADSLKHGSEVATDGSIR